MGKVRKAGTEAEGREGTPSQVSLNQERMCLQRVKRSDRTFQAGDPCSQPKFSKYIFSWTMWKCNSAKSEFKRSLISDSRKLDFSQENVVLVAETFYVCGCHCCCFHLRAVGAQQSAGQCYGVCEEGEHEGIWLRCDATGKAFQSIGSKQESRVSNKTRVRWQYNVEQKRPAWCVCREQSSILPGPSGVGHDGAGPPPSPSTLGC